MECNALDCRVLRLSYDCPNEVLFGAGGLNYVGMVQLRNMETTDGQMDRWTQMNIEKERLAAMEKAAKSLLVVQDEKVSQAPAQL